MEEQEINQEVSIGQWALTIFLTAIPMVGLILLIVWAVNSDTPKSKSNWAKAMLIFYVIGAVFAILFGASIIAFLVASGNLDNL
ncbi:MAG: putative membrane protein YqjE [Candidatus Endobugula sp.]|jgi:uncharacterized membrane protein YqjE